MPRINLKFLIVILGAVTFFAVLNFLVDMFLEEKFRWFEELQAERNFEGVIAERQEMKTALKNKSGVERFFSFKRRQNFNR